METNPVMKAKQKGIKVDRPEDAALANAFVEEKGLSVDILGSDDGMKSFVDIFDPEEGQARKLKDAGIDTANIKIGESLGELAAAATLMEETSKGIEAGTFNASDATSFLSNIDKVAKTFAQAAETGTTLGTDFQKNLIKNAENAEEIGNVDFTDPKALLIVDLKAEFPQFAKLIDENKENAQQIVDLVSMVGPERAGKLFSNSESLGVFLDPANQLMGEQLELGFIDLLAADPTYFKSIIPILKKNPQLPSQLFVELKNLNLAQSELAVVLSDIQVGPQATPPGTPPSQVAQLNLQDEASMLSLLNDHTISNGVLDPQLFVASQQVMASVFFSEANDAYNALSALDGSDGSGSDSDDHHHSHNELVLGGRNITVGSGSYGLNSAAPTDYLVASTDKLTLTGNIVFNASSSDSDLILLSAGTVDLSGLSSISFIGEDLGIGSFDTLEVKNVDLKSEDEISLRSLDNIVINNVNMETTGKGADFIHLIAANELQVNNLYFSDSVKQIAMEAMTINLSHVNFPLNSIVNLKSLYGGVDGKYPNFNTIMYGRVNFIEQIKYGNQLIMDRAAFDAHGGNITIGSGK